MGDKPIHVSHSSASKYKSCPTRYFLAKDYRDKIIYSSLAFGKALEEGVTALLLGQPLENAQQLFIDNWENETVQDRHGNSYKRPVFDNLDVNFYASDYDKNLIGPEEEKLVEEWLKSAGEDRQELLWNEAYEEIAELVKKNRPVNDADKLYYSRVTWLSAKVRGEVMLKAFAEKLLPKLTLHTIDGKPAVQRKIEIKNDEGDTLLGYLDYVLRHEEYEDLIITDLKSAAWKYDDHAIDASEQLRTYLAADGANIGTLRAGYIVLIKKITVTKRCDVCKAPREVGNAKNCKECGKGKYTITELDGEVQFITRKFEESELADLLNDYAGVVTGIKNEVKYKNSASCIQFNRKCEFYDHCWKGKALDEMPNLEAKNKLTTPTEDDTTGEG